MVIPLQVELVNGSLIKTEAGTSPRTLLRRFQAVVGLSPIQYSQQLRGERAKALLKSTWL